MSCAHCIALRMDSLVCSYLFAVPCTSHILIQCPPSNTCYISTVTIQHLHVILIQNLYIHNRATRGREFTPFLHWSYSLAAGCQATSPPAAWCWKRPDLPSRKLHREWNWILPRMPASYKAAHQTRPHVPAPPPLPGRTSCHALSPPSQV